MTRIELERPCPDDYDWEEMKATNTAAVLFLIPGLIFLFSFTFFLYSLICLLHFSFIVKQFLEDSEFCVVEEFIFLDCFRKYQNICLNIFFRFSFHIIVCFAFL
jgi:hypothetical protein